MSIVRDAKRKNLYSITNKRSRNSKSLVLENPFKIKPQISNLICSHQTPLFFTKLGRAHLCFPNNSAFLSHQASLRRRFVLQFYYIHGKLHNRTSTSIC